MKRSAVWDGALLPFRSLVIAQGEVGYAYNLLQESFFNLFVMAVGIERPDIPPSEQAKFYPYALSMWHVFSNDRLQRQLAITALENLPTRLDIKDGIARLKWAKKQTDALSEYRNLIVHAPMLFRYRYPLERKRGKLPQPVPTIGGFSTKPDYAHRLRLIKSPRFWKALRNDLLNLNDYVDFVCRQIGWREYERKNGPIPGARNSWPHRPQLPCVHRIGLIRKTIDRLAGSTPSRGRRRRPSRAAPPI
jgi:hypothetical protein